MVWCHVSAAGLVRLFTEILADKMGFRFLMNLSPSQADVIVIRVYSGLQYRPIVTQKSLTI